VTILVDIEKKMDTFSCHKLSIKALSLDKVFEVDHSDHGLSLLLKLY